MDRRNKRKVIKAAERLEKELYRFSNTMKVIHTDESLWAGEWLATTIKATHLLAAQARTLIIKPHKYFAYWKDE